MRIESVEIYSDASNAAIMRHPGRRFPGLLVQGDTLSTLCGRLDDVCAAARGRLDDEGWLELNELRDDLRDLLNHYKSVLLEHGVELPFVDPPPR